MIKKDQLAKEKRPSHNSHAQRSQQRQLRPPQERNGDLFFFFFEQKSSYLVSTAMLSYEKATRLQDLWQWREKREQEKRGEKRKAFEACAEHVERKERLPEQKADAGNLEMEGADERTKEVSDSGEGQEALAKKSKGAEKVSDGERENEKRRVSLPEAMELLEDILK